MKAETSYPSTAPKRQIYAIRFWQIRKMRHPHPDTIQLWNRDQSWSKRLYEWTLYVGLCSFLLVVAIDGPLLMIRGKQQLFAAEEAGQWQV